MLPFGSFVRFLYLLVSRRPVTLSPFASNYPDSPHGIRIAPHLLVSSTSEAKENQCDPHHEIPVSASLCSITLRT